MLFKSSHSFFARFANQFIRRLSQARLEGVALGLGALAFFGYETHWLYHLYFHWSLGLGLCAFLAGLWIGRSVHWSLVPLFWSFSGSAVWVFHWRWNQYSTESPMDFLALTRISAVALSTTVLVFLSALFFRGRFEWVFRVYRWIALLSSFLILKQTFWHHLSAPERGGILGNPSMDACLIAMTLPWQPGWVYPVVLTAIFATKTSMSLAVLGAMGFALFPRLGFLGALSLGIYGYFSQGAELWNTSGRSHVWKLGLDWLGNWGNLWLGAGAGLSQTLLPRIQLEEYIHRNELFLFFHSDVIQLLFEQGILGLSAGAILYFTALFKTYWSGKEKLRVALFGLLAFMAGNFPFHLFLTAFFSMCLILAALEDSYE